MSRIEDDEKIQNEVRQLRRIVNAIRARINGVWDNRDLKSFGPLTSSENDDILYFIRKGKKEI